MVTSSAPLCLTKDGAFPKAGPGRICQDALSIGMHMHRAWHRAIGVILMFRKNNGKGREWKGRRLSWIDNSGD